MIDQNNPTFDIKDSVNANNIKMNVFEAIATRRSIRKFTSQDIPMEILGVVLDAGRYAPSAGNVQNWRFIIVKDPEKKKQIAEASMQQLWIAEAPVVIVVYAEVEKITQFYGKRGEMLYSIQNCSAAIENMLLTAHSLGLGSTWVSAFDEDMLKRAVGIPDGIRPQAVLPIGYPDEVVPAPGRYDMEDLVFHENFGARYANMERILQNPVVFDKISKVITGVIDAAKDGIQKKTSSKK